MAAPGTGNLFYSPGFQLAGTKASAQGIIQIAAEEDFLPGLVIALVGSYFPGAPGKLADKLSVRFIKVQVIIPVPAALPYKT
jgi:hypothetical protein